MDRDHLLEDLRLGMRWTPAIPLEYAVAGHAVPTLPGMYRIRRVSQPAWDYIGQTGTGTMNLRKRMAMIKDAYAPEIPYRDPHTAGPGFCALRHQTGQPFEASSAPSRDQPLAQGH
jgi:hypothetical protein